MPANLPAEVARMLRTPGGRSLLVKGPAGTGKTMFVLEIIRSCGGMYISSSVSAQRLYREYPGLDRVLPPDAVIDTTAQSGSPRVIDSLKSGQTDSILRDIIADLRVSEQLPAPFKEHLGRLRTAKVPFSVIFDSWDAIFATAREADSSSGEQGYDPDELHRIILSYFRNFDANLVMVTEGDSHEHLNFLVDGVVELERRTERGRLVRVLRIQKLRGEQVPHPEILFTLEGARFLGFEPNPPVPTAKRTKWNPRPDPKGAFSTGSPSLDAVLGGALPRGSTVLIEAANDVPDGILGELLKSITANFLSQGRPVMVVPFGGLNLDDLERDMHAYIGKEQFDTLFRAAQRADTPGANERGHIIPLHYENLGQDTHEWTRVYNRLREKSGQPMLEIIGMDTQAARYGEQQYGEIVSSSAERAKRDGSLLLRLSRPGLDLVSQRTRNVSDVHLHLATLHGVPVLYGDKPRTPYHAIRPVAEEGNVRLALTPIV